MPLWKNKKQVKKFSNFLLFFHIGIHFQSVEKSTEQNFMMKDIYFIYILSRRAAGVGGALPGAGDRHLAKCEPALTKFKNSNKICYNLSIGLYSPLRFCVKNLKSLGVKMYQILNSTKHFVILLITQINYMNFSNSTI